MGTLTLPALAITEGAQSVSENPTRLRLQFAHYIADILEKVGPLEKTDDPEVLRLALCGKEMERLTPEQKKNVFLAEGYVRGGEVFKALASFTQAGMKMTMLSVVTYMLKVIEAGEEVNEHEFSIAMQEQARGQKYSFPSETGKSMLSQAINEGKFSLAMGLSYLINTEARHDARLSEDQVRTCLHSAIRSGKADEYLAAMEYGISCHRPNISRAGSEFFHADRECVDAAEKKGDCESVYAIYRRSPDAYKPADWLALGEKLFAVGKYKKACSAFSYGKAPAEKWSALALAALQSWDFKTLKNCCNYGKIPFPAEDTCKTADSLVKMGGFENIQMAIELYSLVHAKHELRELGFRLQMVPPRVDDSTRLYDEQRRTKIIELCYQETIRLEQNAETK